ncbi:ABC transporter ATP-binding protein [Streptomyces sp. S.PNR 29]|uniref:ATP-binding cassette domain-containing protein n=1 Tax=Streptomyces sp. S.PNR 29 TaxID=2973805 RepID=UPI0025AFDFF4|nr:ABC transporter ATP-binding protein [Streptomyces sp. S.PNR 29]MDN0200666.1 ABC transporter ATP-binding protein [Streptomyces sp. S.PNR 29]
MRLDAVSKRYGRGGWVLRDVHAEISPGDVVAFSGGNGAGKSTLLRILAGVSRPTSGSVTGRPTAVGYVPDRFSPQGRMSALSYLTHMGRIRGLPTRTAAQRARQLLDRLSPAGGEEAQLQTLSKGNAQKVALAQALIVRPGLLVLDEPWSGLDASAHGVLAEVMKEVAEAGGAVVFTDHRAAVVRAHATRSYTVRDGGVSAGPTGPGASARPVTEVLLTCPDSGRIPAPLDWSALDGVVSVSDQGTTTAVRVDQACSDALLLVALRQGWSVAGLVRDADGLRRHGHGR